MKLRPDMTLQQFDNGYWYAIEIKAFAKSLGVKGVSRLRKDQLENIIRHFLKTGRLQKPTQAEPKNSVRDSEKKLTLRTRVRRYTNDKATKDFLVEQASRRVPNFKHAPGTKYLLNRWREAQLAAGVALTYGDLVRQAIVLNETKTGPLRTQQGRYNNFTSDYFAAHPHATQAEVAKAWHQVKKMNAPKTYQAWAKKHT